MKRDQDYELKAIVKTSREIQDELTWLEDYLSRLFDQDQVLDDDLIEVDKCIDGCKLELQHLSNRYLSIAGFNLHIPKAA